MPRITFDPALVFSDEGIVQGTATSLNVVGAGGSVAVASGVATLTLNTTAVDATIAALAARVTTLETRLAASMGLASSVIQQISTSTAIDLTKRVAHVFAASGLTLTIAAGTVVGQEQTVYVYIASGSVLIQTPGAHCFAIFNSTPDNCTLSQDNSWIRVKWDGTNWAVMGIHAFGVAFS